jgi:hypothetical protein
VRTTKQNNLFWHNHLTATNACVLINCEITIIVLVNNGTKQMKYKAYFPGVEPNVLKSRQKFIKEKNTLQSGDGKHF